MLVCASVQAHVESLQGHPHQDGVTYTSIGVYKGGVKLLYTAPAADLRKLDSREPEDLLPLVSAGFVIKDGLNKCQLRGQRATDYYAINAYQFTLDYACDDGPELLSISYNLFAYDPTHINYLDVVVGAQPLRAVLNESNNGLVVPIQYLLEQSGWQLMDHPPALNGEKPDLLKYLTLGYEHVLSGWDHLVFVLGLVVLVRRFSMLACFGIYFSYQRFVY